MTSITINPDVMSGRPVIAGTRIPTSAILAFHKAGYCTEAIIAEYPDLTPDDISAALAFELSSNSNDQNASGGLA